MKNVFITQKQLAVITAFILGIFLSNLSLILPSSLAELSSISQVRKAKADSNTSFYPIWNLLKPEERKMFVSGYLHGWRDSKRVTEILLNHINENPQNAISSLEKVRDIYKVGDIPVDQLISRLTQFYSEPSNHNAPLSVAISSSRG